MTKARFEQIDLDSTPFYHCYVRCVRRAYLCGEDRFTGENFDHRKQWIVSRLKFLSYVYAIDICAYAVMSNHYHVVLHVDKARADSWSDEEVVERWMQLYKGDVLVNRWLQTPNDLPQATLMAVKEVIAKWRVRLHSIDWFMRGINETIARMANEEEGCKGRFWEGRYKSQALLDEVALLSCMAYVDLNPVRADMADDLASSDFTSIQQRIHEYGLSSKSGYKKVTQAYKKQQAIEKEMGLDVLPKADLKPFDGSAHTEISVALPFTLADYFDLVDSTGREIRSDKRGAIIPGSQRLLHALGVDPDAWIDHIQQFGLRYRCGVGSVVKLAEYAVKKDKKWLKGVSQSSKMYQSGY